MISLLMLYPGLAAVKLVGTDLVQAVPLVLAAAISNIALHGLDWEILIPLLIGSVPGTILGSKIAPKVPQSFIRRGIVVVLTMSGVALLDKAGWAPLGAGTYSGHSVRSSTTSEPSTASAAVCANERSGHFFWEFSIALGSVTTTDAPCSCICAATLRAGESPT